MLQATISKGQVLLAEPFMLDPNFKRAAVLLCDHADAEGSFGLILNRPLQSRIDEIIDDFPECEAEVFFGGPVAVDGLTFLHNKGDLLEESAEIVPGVYLGGDFDQLKFLISSKLMLPGDVRFFLGYAGWSEGQLLEEMKYGSWVLANMEKNYLYKTNPELLWKQIMSNKGDTFAILSEIQEEYSWN